VPGELGPLTKVNFDYQVWDELCSLRFIDAGHNALVLRPGHVADDGSVSETLSAEAAGELLVRARFSARSRVISFRPT
jgi:hypothetical protein